MARLLVLVGRSEALYDNSPILNGLLRCDFIQRSTKGVFANDPNNKRARRVAKRILGPFDVAAEAVKEYGFHGVLVGDTDHRLSLLALCWQRLPPRHRQYDQVGECCKRSPLYRRAAVARGQEGDLPSYNATCQIGSVVSSVRCARWVYSWLWWLESAKPE